MKVRSFLALIVLSQAAQASPMPEGYGVGRANEGAEQPAQVDYGAVVVPKAPGPLQAMSQPAPQRINNTYTVTTIADTGPGSLRAAITSANSNAGLDAITFAIGSGQVTITPASQLPDITDPVVIDGSTQPGWAGLPIVELAGTNLANAIGLVIKAGGSTVRGLVINRWKTTGSGGYGIVLDVGGGNAIEGCWIGIGQDGLTARPNAVNGIVIFGTSTNNRIGGTSILQRNVLSGNTSSGIQIASGNGGFNTILGNWIGLNGFGSGLLANGGNGIFLNSSDNTIGGKEPGSKNIISGNAFPGIFIGNACQRTLVVGNWIGTDQTGTLDWGNLQNGVNIDQASNNQIGDGTFLGRNVISGNDFPGVYVLGPGTGNKIQGNFICTSVAGTAAIGTGNGIVLDNVTNTTVGGTTPAARNVIAGTPANSGIALINGATLNKITGNYIGTDSTGTLALPTLKGILLNGVSNNTVGGTLAGEGNVISGNMQYGVETRGTTTGNKIYGNWIGTDPTGSSPVPNQLDGVVLNSSNTEVKFNTVAFNLRAGVFDSTGSKNPVELNSIFANGVFGIDNFPRNLTINDDQDADVGANDLQNFPVLDSVRVNDVELKIIGYLKSRPNRSYRLNFYDNTTCGTAHFGEGRTFRTSVNVTTDGFGLIQFAVSTPPAIVPPNYITATATDILDGSTSEFSQCVCTKDTDGDGIMDCWETQNWGIDINSDGVRDLDLYARGARPDHKDVFVEVDAMNDHVPPVFSLQMVIDAFARAPQDEVHNPDGLDGINLHAALDETNIPQQYLVHTFDDLEQIKVSTFGTAAEKSSANHTYILAAKRLVYRYCMFVRTFTNDEGDTTSRGFAEGHPIFGSDDFVIGLGSTGNCNNTSQINDLKINAGAFMHELGHSLGLDHGGPDGDEHQFKPNYYSVMNYVWAVPRDNWQGPYQWRLDYAHKPPRDPDFRVLFETGLSEPDGLVYTAGPIISVPYTDANYFVNIARAEAGIGVDWNGDGVIAGTHPVDVNEPMYAVTDCSGFASVTQTPGETLGPGSDWDNLRYNFRSSPGFHPPSLIGTTGSHATLGTLTAETISEPSAAQEKILDNLPAPRPKGKFTMNGVLDASAVPLATNAGITLYGVYKPPQLYLATNAAAAQGGDMVVLLSDARGSLRAAPLGKAGQAGSWDASLFGRAAGDPAAWADSAGTLTNSVTVDTSGAVLEGVVDVGLLFGRNPSNLYLALAKYAPGAGGALLAQAPAGNGDGNVDGAEYLQLNGVVSVPEVPVASGERVRVELLGAQPATHGARVRLTLGVAGDVDITLQNVAGRRIARVAGGTYEAGVHDFTVRESLAPGVYFLVTRALGETRATRVVIVR